MMSQTQTARGWGWGKKEQKRQRSWTRLASFKRQFFFKTQLIINRLKRVLWVFLKIIIFDSTPIKSGPCWFFAVFTRSPSRGADVTVYVWHKPTELAHSFSFCSCVRFCLYVPFSCISFQKFSRQLSVFWLCSCDLISDLLVLSITYLLWKSPSALSPDVILCVDWAQSTN